MKYLLAILALTACSGTQEHPCSPEAAEAIMVGARAAVDHLVNSGACPEEYWPDLTECPHYQTIRSAAKRALEDGACR